MRSTRSTTSRSKPAATISAAAAVLLDVVVEDVVEQRVVGQRVAVELPGRSSADGGLLMLFSGSGGISPRSSADLLRHCASRHTASSARP
jgi:hypothetical protein